MLSMRTRGQSFWLMLQLPCTNSATALPAAWSVMHERRNVLAPAIGVAVNPRMPPDILMVVPPAQEADGTKVVGLLSGMPLPMIVIPIPLGTIMPEVLHAQV